MKFINTRFILIVILLMVSAFSSNAHQESKHLHRMGSHGMVLFTDGTTLYANHLPLYRKPHDYQLIYQVNTKQNQKIIDYLQGDSSLSADKYLSQMVTILPEPFDLNRLIENQQLTLSTTVFKGHFERGGKTWLEDIQLEFVKMLVNKQITVSNNDVKTQKQQWLVRELALTTDKLFIHVINEKPSYDALIIGRECSDTLGTNTMLIAQPIDNKSPLLLKTPCKQQRLLYYETQDFSE